MKLIYKPQQSPTDGKKAVLKRIQDTKILKSKHIIVVTTGGSIFPERSDTEFGLLSFDIRGRM